MRIYTLLTILFVGLVIIASPSSGLCQADAPNSSMFYPKNLNNISLAIGLDDQQRELKMPGDAPAALLDAEHIYGVLSCDLAPWITASVGAGSTKLNADQSTGQTDNDKRRGMWMVGITSGLWGRTIYDPDFMACHTRISAGLSHWSHDARIGDATAEWEELRATLLFSAEVFARDFGEDETMSPYSIIFSLGGIYSDISMDVDTVGQPSVSLSDSDGQGFIGGVTIKMAHNFSLGWEARVFEKTTNSARLAYHF